MRSRTLAALLVSSLSTQPSLGCGSDLSAGGSGSVDSDATPSSAESEGSAEGDSAEGDSDSAEGDSDSDTQDSDTQDSDTQDSDTQDSSGECVEPGAPALEVSLAPIKQVELSWSAAPGAELYRVWAYPELDAEPVELAGALEQTSYSLSLPLHTSELGSYAVEACNQCGCASSELVAPSGTLTDAIGYIKASNTDASDLIENDLFGFSLALSADGQTLAVGAMYEDGGSGIDGDQSDESVPNAGAVYVFVRDEQLQWTQQSYIKASNPGELDDFGVSVALSPDGSTLAVGARLEDSEAEDAGVVYMFGRDGQGQWTQETTLSAGNAGPGDRFGVDLEFGLDGELLAVGAFKEDSAGPMGNDDDATDAGAVYIFAREEQGWQQQAYIKANSPDVGDLFGVVLALTADAELLAVGAPNRDYEGHTDAGAVFVFRREGQAWTHEAELHPQVTSEGDAFGSGVSLGMSAQGAVLAIGAAGEDSGAQDSGAAYVFVRDEQGAWSQSAHLEAPNAGAGDSFGYGVVLNADARVLAVSALLEGGGGLGIGGEGENAAAPESGAVYVLAYDELNGWTDASYIKASNTDAGDFFGYSMAMSGDASLLAVGAVLEASRATGIGGDQLDNSAPGAGAVYLY